MRFDERIRCALVPVICAIFSTGIAAVILIELGESVTDLPTHIRIMIFLVPAAYAILSALVMVGVISKDGAVVLSLFLIPVFIVFELFTMGIVIPAGIDGIG